MKNLIASSAIVLTLLLNPAFAEEAIKAEVQTSVQKQLTEDEAAASIRVSKEIIPLKSKLKKRYTGYKVTIINDYPGTLKLTSGNINNGFPGVSAYTTVETSKANMWWSALGGLPGIIVIGLPILGVISHSNGKAEKEAALYSNQIPEMGLNKGQAFSFNALVPLGQAPQINLVFKDPKTGLEFAKNSL